MVPFTFTPAPPEIHLTNAPLERVLGQVRFSRAPELIEPEVEKALAADLKDYPVRDTVQGVALQLPGMQPQVESFRTFEDAEGAWKVTVASDFVALETGRYDSRSDFLSRLGRVLEAVAGVGAPPRVTRIGIRYLDRIVDPVGLANLVNPALLGWLPELADSDEVLNHQILQTLLHAPDGASKVQVRSLCLPENVSFDPLIQPVPKRSWVLDIDAFDETPTTFVPAATVDAVNALSQHAYSVFRWATTAAFLTRYGGTSAAKEGDHS
jgi:uncharacterized protein (TIGR04255 family)